MRHGYGKYTWRPLAEEEEPLRSPNNIATFHDTFVGQWENDKMSGLGRLDSAHNSLEIGTFANGKMHGYGMRILKSRPQAVSAASLLSGRAVFGARQVFVGYFEDDVFFGVRNREQEEEFQQAQAARLDRPINFFASKPTQKTGQTNTPSPKRFPVMSESEFDPKVAEDVEVRPFHHLGVFIYALDRASLRKLK
jgi:hypothetical protein